MINFINNWFKKRGYGKDKPMHFWRLGVYIFIPVYLICFFHFFKSEHWTSVGVALLFVAGVDLSKEILDHWQRNKITGKRFDWIDLLAGIAGGFFAATVITILWASFSIFS